MSTNALLRGFRPGFAVGLFVTLFSAGQARAQLHYSANVLGYVDANFVAGSNLMTNPLFAFDNSISNLLRDVPVGSRFVPWDRATQQFGPANQRTAGGWITPEATLLAPDGGFLVLPAATKVSFVGQAWSGVRGPRCLTYPQGESLFGWLPASCCALDCDVLGTPPYTDLTTVSRWNRQAQAFEDSMYWQEFGWFPNDPEPLAPDESVLFTIFDSFTAKSPFASSLQDYPVPAQVPSASMVQPQRDGTNFIFRWSSTNEAPYAVFCSTNLRVVNWTLAGRGTATPTGGVCTVTVASTNRHAYYRLQPDWGATTTPVLLMGHRNSSSSFSFQFYAPAAATYTVEQTSSMTNPTWSTVTSLAAGPSNIVAVVDNAATGSVRYYRVTYLE